ncbi:hypothetical protein SFC43_01550 [Bacteroides sp. CR5/BHMF/2]|nr:hypothetical protein [Bacteroides sp. CR5/BHMF/2]
MDKLNKDLRDKAILYGLCEQWTNDWSENRNKQELIEMWLRGLILQYCIIIRQMSLLKRLFHKNY